MPTYAESLRNKWAAKAHKELDHIRIHHAENGGHIVEHHFQGSDGPYHEPEKHVFGKDEGHKLMAHVSKHMGVKAEAAEEEEEE